MFSIIGAIMFAGVSVGGKAPPEKAKTELGIMDTAATVTDTPATTAIAAPETPAAVVEEDSGLSSWLEKIYLFLGSVVGITILRFFLRYLPSAANYDFVGWIVKLINLIYGAWVENRKSGGGTFKRNYSK